MLLPAFVRWQVEPNQLNPWILIGAATVGGALAGLVWRVEARLLGAFAGGIAGLGGLYAVDFYLTGRTQVYVFEMLLPIVIGCLPGILVFVALSRLTRKSAEG